MLPVVCGCRLSPELCKAQFWVARQVMPSIVHPVATVAQIGRALTPPKGELLARVRPRTPAERMARAEEAKKELLHPRKDMTTNYHAMREVEKRLEQYRGKKAYGALQGGPHQLVYRYDDGPRNLKPHEHEFVPSLTPTKPHPGPR